MSNNFVNCLGATEKTITYQFCQYACRTHFCRSWSFLLSFSRWRFSFTFCLRLSFGLRLNICLSARFFLALRGASFGRCDLRVDADGTPFMLEINPNCGVYYPPTAPGSADLCLASDPAGHEGFTRQLVAAALRRHARRNGGEAGTGTDRRTESK